MNSSESQNSTTATGGSGSGSDVAPPASASADPTTALVPQLSKFGITEQDLSTAIRVLDAISSLDPKKRKRKQQTQKQERQANSNSNKKRKADDTGDTTNKDEKEKEEDTLSQYRQSNLRHFRKSLAPCLSLHQQIMYEGKTESQFRTDRMASRTLKRQKMAEGAQQKKYVASTALRRGRVEKLERLREESREEEEGKLMQFLIPDGHVDTDTGADGGGGGGGGGGVKLLENGGCANTTQHDGEEDGKKQSSNDDNDDKQSNNTNAKEDSKDNNTTVLPKLRSCYVCKIRFRILHHFYDQLCPDCASINYTKRHQSANLSQKVAIVTGSRVKIGFQVCLKLLRSGATVIATTRFPNNAVNAYRNEKDFDVWKDRLHVYGLDLRDVTGLEAFTRYLKMSYGECGIDVLINNACQTVRRPGGYYMPLVQKEGELWNKGDKEHLERLDGCREFERIRRRLVVEHHNSNGEGGGGGGLLGVGVVKGAMTTNGQEGKLLLGDDKNSAMHDDNDKEQDGTSNTGSSQIIEKADDSSKESNKKNVPFETTGISHSAAMSQMTIVPEDVGIDEKTLPSGLSDINGQQLDLRSNNSWLLKMDQVSTPEIMECMYINAIAPFVLNSRLKPLMEAPASDPNRADRYIINVSAMEGKFYRYKMPNHPHTNMAKAALNMLTRTSSEDLAKKSRIYMNSVDTGWINDENPLEKASKIATINNFQTPIDEVDAAARTLDPVFVGINLDDGTTEGDDYDKEATCCLKDYGKFFKDYKETEW